MNKEKSALNSGFSIDWTGLKNPILEVPDRMLKDQCVIYRDGFFYVFTSLRSAENYQWLQIDGHWHMVATARGPEAFNTGGNGYTGNHEPFLWRMAGDGSEDAHWTHWVDRRHLVIPTEDWNTVMRANSAFLADWRDYDGYFYLFYAGSNDDKRFDGRGHGKIGVARSRDLKTWSVAGSE